MHGCYQHFPAHFTFTYHCRGWASLAVQTASFRCPRHKGNFDADLAVLENAHLHLNILAVGSRRYSAFSIKQKLPTYVVVNLAGSYEILPNFTVFGRIDNLLDEEYEEVPGYGTSRVAGYGGFRVSF